MAENLQYEDISGTEFDMNIIVDDMESLSGTDLK